MILFKKARFLFVLLALVATSGFSAQKTIALTIDDLPFVGESKSFHLDMIIKALTTADVPATGFVIAGEVTESNMPALHRFRDAGFGVGNHTMTHANLNAMNAEAYISEIKRADKILAPVLTKPKYFRYPYLVLGQGSKKEAVQNYLNDKHYEIAPITIDSKDFIFNQLLLSVSENERRFFLNVLRPCYVDFIWEQTLKAEEHNKQARKLDQPQILLIHANLLNAYVLPDIINMYKQNGYKFISLPKALHTGESEADLPAGKSSPKKRWFFSKADAKIESFMAWD